MWVKDNLNMQTYSDRHPVCVSVSERYYKRSHTLSERQIEWERYKEMAELKEKLYMQKYIIEKDPTRETGIDTLCL